MSIFTLCCNLFSCVECTVKMCSTDIGILSCVDSSSSSPLFPGCEWKSVVPLHIHCLVVICLMSLFCELSVLEMSSLVIQWHMCVLTVLCYLQLFHLVWKSVLCSSRLCDDLLRLCFKVYSCVFSMRKRLLHLGSVLSTPSVFLASDCLMIQVLVVTGFPVGPG